MSDVAKMRSSLSSALEKIGHTNGHAYQGQDNSGALLHEYYVATEGESFFKKRREVAKAALEEAGMLEKAESVPSGSEEIIAVTKGYDLFLKVANPTQRFDKGLLPKVLINLFKAKPDQIDAVIAQCTKEGEPSRTYKAVPKG